MVLLAVPAYLKRNVDYKRRISVLKQCSLTAPLVEILNGTSFIAMRSIASKLVPTEELGECSLKIWKNNGFSSVPLL
jgi:hypothetical protein